MTIVLSVDDTLPELALAVASRSQADSRLIELRMTDVAPDSLAGPLESRPHGDFFFSFDSSSERRERRENE